ncbi:hypothetical protein HU727_000290 [Pseudomonas sp. SWRI153]|uniref:GGDEF domain-containing protein n=1 Tax=Pseudomonas khorasanensis TaxID=2745508 RepID=A0A923JFZ8_9PSED|nr:hypothetical protein [Pseudomonas khorasanensis]MBV4484021.1 hypothetical protein [Pseudomonas khorasanensis]
MNLVYPQDDLSIAKPGSPGPTDPDLINDDTLHSLLLRADHGMYRAKRSGRNRTCMEMPNSTYA